MATNPQYPEQRGPEKGTQGPRKVPDVHPKLQVPPKQRFPWPLVAIIIAAAILAAIIFGVARSPRQNRTPSGAQVPAQPTGNQLQLGNLSIKQAPAGNAFYLEGNVHNNGNTDVTGIQVQASFKGANGQTLEVETRPLEAVSGGPNGSTDNFTKSPLKPNDSRLFRSYFDHYPDGWNKEMPELKVTLVTGAGS